MPDPLFSVVVPTYGRPRFLAEAVASVLAQMVDDFECLVIDDASPDPIDVPDDPRVRVIRRQENGGPSAARNTGLDHARGRYVSFLDDDDVYAPDRLALAIEGLARAPVSICWVTYIEHRDEPAHDGRVIEGHAWDTILDDLTPSLGATAVRRDAVLRFDERLDNLEDVDWWLRTAKSHLVSTVRQTGCYYRRHDEPRHRTGVHDRIRANLEFLEGNAGYFDGHPAAAAFRWRRVGLLARQVGDRGLARVAFARSLRLRPDGSAAWHLARSVGRTATRVALPESGAMSAR